MTSTSIQRLWKLNEVDTAIAEVKNRAAALDPGKRLMAEIKAIESELEQASATSKALSAEQTDLELLNKGIADKLKKIDKDLFGGLIVNPREVENYEKEIAMLKRQRDANDERLLQLMELVPPAVKVSAALEEKLSAKKAELKEHQRGILKDQERLKAEYARLNAERPAAAQHIEPSLMARYEAIRKNQGGIGMSRITKQSRCGQCGMDLATRLVEHAKEGRLVTCEACHRLLYFSEGLI